MCRNTTTLSELDAWHYVTCCEHGTVHVVWSRLSLHLRTSDFARLTAAAVYVWQQASLLAEPALHFRLGVDDLILHLPAETFVRLLKLMRQAAGRLGCDPSPSATNAAAWQVGVLPTGAPPRPTLSLN